MDVMTPSQRLKAMRSNRGRTKPERRFAAALWRRGFRYFTPQGYKRRTGTTVRGSPDMIFAGRRVVVFVDGCFWHGCRRCHDFERDCSEWWQAKIARNVRRDARNRRALRRAGWCVLVVREHDLLRKPNFDRAVQRVVERLAARG